MVLHWFLMIFIILYQKWELQDIGHNAFKTKEQNRQFWCWSKSKRDDWFKWFINPLGSHCEAKKNLQKNFSKFGYVLRCKNWTKSMRSLQCSNRWRVTLAVLGPSNPIVKPWNEVETSGTPFINSRCHRLESWYRFGEKSWNVWSDHVP